jgi:hypothetical protein
MKAVYRLTKSQQQALCTILGERSKDKKARNVFLDVTTNPPTTVTAAELYTLFCDPQELEADKVETGKQYKGVVSMYMVEEHQVLVTLKEFNPTKHVKAEIEGHRLEVGDEVEVQYSDKLTWKARKAHA